MRKLAVLLLAFSLITSLASSGSMLMAQGKEKKKGKEKAVAKPAAKGGAEKAKIDYLFIEANTQYLQGNKPEAIALFKEVLELDPNHDASMYNVGRIYAELGDHENARRYCESALQRNPENYWYYTELVLAYERTHANEKALSTQEALVKRFPNEKNGLYDLAQMYIGRKRYQDALNTYTQLEKLTGMNEEVVYRKHQLCLFLNQPEKALLELDRLVAVNPMEQRYHQGRYDIYMMMGQADKAFAVLEDLLKTNPDDGFAMLSLADHYKSLGQMEKSDEYLFRAFRNPSVDLEAKIKILGGLYGMADQDKAMLTRVTQLSDILLQVHPQSALSSGIRGDIYQMAGKPDSARVCYLQSIVSDPANEQVWQELLLIDSELNDFNSMRKDAEKALEYFPNQSAFLYFYGLGSERTDQNDEAIYAFEKLKKISSATKELHLQAFLSLGALYHKTEDYNKSEENFEQAVSLDGNNPLVLNNYAYYLSLRSARLPEAEKMVLKALDQHPNSGAYQDTYGWILFLKGDVEGAKSWIGKAVENGGGAEVLEHYGDVWMRLGDVEKAKSFWQKALDEGADNFTIADKLKTSRQP